MQKAKIQCKNQNWIPHPPTTTFDGRQVRNDKLGFVRMPEPYLLRTTLYPRARCLCHVNVHGQDARATGLNLIYGISPILGFIHGQDARATGCPCHKIKRNITLTSS